jgi:hypothetical protein
MAAYPKSRLAAVTATASKISTDVTTEMVIKNSGSNAVAVGGWDLAWATSFKIDAGGVVSMTLRPGQELWARCNTALTSTLEILEQN